MANHTLKQEKALEKFKIQNWKILKLVARHIFVFFRKELCETIVNYSYLLKFQQKPFRYNFAQ